MQPLDSHVIASRGGHVTTPGGNMMTSRTSQSRRHLHLLLLTSFIVGFSSTVATDGSHQNQRTVSGPLKRTAQTQTDTRTDRRKRQEEKAELVFKHTVTLMESDFNSLPRKIYKCAGDALNKGSQDLKVVFSVINEPGSIPEGIRIETIDANHAWLLADKAVDREAGWERFEIDVKGEIENDVVHEILRVVVEIEDENDNAPKFEASNLQGQLEENSPPGLVMQVQASDADDGINAEIFYELLQVTDDADAPVEDAIFSLDAESGSLTSMETLDREKSSYYNITVSAKDKGTPPLETVVTLQVHVTDVNDNPPECETDGVHCEIPEHTPQATPLAAVDPKCKFQCQDKDSTFGRVKYIPDEDSPDCFISVDGDGNVSLTKEIDIEALEKVAFVCTVLVQDADNAAFQISRTAHFTITDINDNAPFPNEEYQIVIPYENNTEAYVHPDVISFHDKDKDSANGDAFDISLDQDSDLEGNLTVLMGADQKSVQFKLLTALDYGEFKVPLKVCDGKEASSQCRVHKVSLSVRGPPDAAPLAAALGPVHIAVIIIAVLLLLLLVLAAICLTQMRERRRRTRLPDNEEVSEITRYFDEEGPGDEDTEAFDIMMLRKPMTPLVDDTPTIMDIPLEGYIKDRLNETDHDASAPLDRCIPFGYEGEGSIAESLSTLNSEGSDNFDFDELQNWGPWFSKLATMYSGADGEDDEQP